MTNHCEALAPFSLTPRTSDRGVRAAVCALAVFDAHPPAPFVVVSCVRPSGLPRGHASLACRMLR